MLGWLTTAEVAELWPDAPDDDLLELLVAAAVAQLETFAPAVEGNVIPEHWNLALLMQVRNLWNAQKTDPASGGFGDDGFVFRPFPLDWTVKAILRPKNPVPVVA